MITRHGFIVIGSALCAGAALAACKGGGETLPGTAGQSSPLSPLKKIRGTSLVLNGSNSPYLLPRSLAVSYDYDSVTIEKGGSLALLGRAAVSIGTLTIKGA